MAHSDNVGIAFERSDSVFQRLALGDRRRVKNVCDRQDRAAKTQHGSLKGGRRARRRLEEECRENVSFAQMRCISAARAKIRSSSGRVN
jgi:hypothetical protein